MKKNGILIIGIVSIVIMGIILGIFLAGQGKEQEKENVQEQKNEIENNQIELEEKEENVQITVSQEIKTGPNTKIQKRVYYTICDHIVTDEEIVSTEDVNKTEKELKTKYAEWRIEDFSSSQVVLYQEIDETCPQHFKLIEDEGVIAIYQANKDGVYQIVDKTEINTKYLSEEDQAKLREGILIVGEEKMNSILEDYE